MRSARIRHLLSVGAVLALTAALAPGGLAAPGPARAAVGPTTSTATSTATATATATAAAAAAASSAARQAAANGASFNPANAYVPGSSATGQPSPASPASPTDLTPPGTAAAAAAGASTTANAAGGSLGLNLSGSVESAQGAAMSDPLPGGDSLEFFSQGVVSRVRSDGSAVWQRGSNSLYRDWHVDFGNATFTVTPQLAIGTDPANPFQVTTAEPFAMTNTHPYAVGDLTGDGSTDIAVAEAVGINLGASTCGCGGRFTVPGSDLHVGTFVTVLDARSGKTLYSELDPGFVPQLAIAGRTLLIGDESGPPSSPNAPGAWGSVSNVRALTLHGDRGALNATQAWQYSTKAQWGMLLGLQTVGGDTVVSWSDTPLGLGQPGPPDGHVVRVDSHGRVVWDQRTAGYPVLSAYDQSRGELAVVDETDPTQGLSYTLTGLRVSDGRAVSKVTTTGVLPTALSISALTAWARPSWLVAGVVTTANDVQPPYYSFSAGTISAVDPEAQRTLWSRTLTAAGPNPPQPGAIEVATDWWGRTSVVVGSWAGAPMPSPSSPLTAGDDLQAFSGATGAPLWDRSGDVPDPLTLATVGDTVRGITPEQDVLSYRAADGEQVGRAPLAGVIDTAAAGSVDGRSAYFTGDESGAVYALDAASLTAGDDVPRVLWRADVGGPVNQIVPAEVGGRSVLAVAATSGLALVDARTGRVLDRMALPGQYAWNVAVGSVGGRTVVVSATDRLSAFDAVTGKPLWTYQPTDASYFSDASVVDGMVVSEYQSKVLPGKAPTAMAAVGVDAGTGHAVWTAAGDPTTTSAAQLRNGVIAGPGIAGAGADGAAFTWTTKTWQGRVDVRDARTGALDYSDTADELAQHENYSLDPTAGLVSIGSQGVVSIAPGGPIAVDWLGGSDVAVAESGGAPVLLEGEAGVAVYPLSALSGGPNPLMPLAQNRLFLGAQLSVTGGSTVLATPINWFEHQMLSTESGEFGPPYSIGQQKGLAVYSLTGTPAANAVRQPAVNRPLAPSRPTSLALSDDAAAAARIGLAQPAAQVEVHGYSATGAPQLTTSAPTGYDPATIRAYLGLHGTGAGQTVAVVDAPGDPNIVGDVDKFSAQFGLPQTCTATVTANCFTFTVAADGGPSTQTPDPDWGLETSMDVEWIHAVAPQASVVLEEAATGSFAALFHAVQTAAALRPDAISMSWGIGGEFVDETYYDHFCQLTDSVCVASSGDRGNPGSYPAYNPATIAIGGTTLKLTPTGGITSETAWSGSGGGQSYVEPTPAYQQPVVTGGRGTPDASYDADPSTGVSVYDSYAYQGQSGWFQVGGTSLGAPSWAAIITSADQLRSAAGTPKLTSAAGAAQRAIYGSASQLGQIVSGSNGFCPKLCTAGPGYNFVTGLGSPRSALDVALAAAP